MSASYRLERAGKQDRSTFDCGDATMNRYLAAQLSQDIRRNACKAFFIIDAVTDRLAGFYTLSAGAITRVLLPADLERGQARYVATPAALLGRLAIDLAYQGQGLGPVLLQDAASRSLIGDLGASVMLVDAKSPAARRFYLRLGFAPVIGQDDQLVISLVALQKSRNSMP